VQESLRSELGVLLALEKLIEGCDAQRIALQVVEGEPFPEWHIGDVPGRAVPPPDLRELGDRLAVALEPVQADRPSVLDIGRPFG